MTPTARRVEEGESTLRVGCCITPVGPPKEETMPVSIRVCRAIAKGVSRNRQGFVSKMY